MVNGFAGGMNGAITASGVTAREGWAGEVGGGGAVGGCGGGMAGGTIGAIGAGGTKDVILPVAAAGCGIPPLPARAFFITASITTFTPSHVSRPVGIS